MFEEVLVIRRNVDDGSHLAGVQPGAVLGRFDAANVDSVDDELADVVRCSVLSASFDQLALGRQSCLLTLVLGSQAIVVRLLQPLEPLVLDRLLLSSCRLEPLAISLLLLLEDLASSLGGRLERQIDLEIRSNVSLSNRFRFRHRRRRRHFTHQMSDSVDVAAAPASSTTSNATTSTNSSTSTSAAAPPPISFSSECGVFLCGCLSRCSICCCFERTEQTLFPNIMRARWRHIVRHKNGIKTYCGPILDASKNAQIEEVAALSLESKTVSGMQYSNDGALFVVVDSANGVHVYSAVTQTLLRTIARPNVVATFISPRT
jgi:hypothetical protein